MKSRGKTEKFATGSVRDSQEGKLRFDLIPVEALRRDAELYRAGAKKYAEDNWRKGQPYRRVYASILRHLFAWRIGMKDEDHLAAVRFGCAAIMEYDKLAKRGAKKYKRLDNRGR